MHWNIYTDTPVPQEEAAGQNPLDGAIFDYFLKEKATGEVNLEIFDASGKSVCKFSSNDKPYKIPEVNIPLYGIRPQQILSGEAGSQRFVWDMHYKPSDEPSTYPISATYMDTAPDPTSPWVLPENYTAKITTNASKETEAKLNKLKNAFSSIFNILVDTDMPVTSQTVKALEEVQKELLAL